MTQSATFPSIHREKNSITSGKPSFLHHPQAYIIPISYRDLLHHSDAQSVKTAFTPLMPIVTIKIYDKRTLWRDMVFPLQCPNMEYDSIPLGMYELIYSKSGIAELDCMFTTNFPEDVKETCYE